MSFQQLADLAQIVASIGVIVSLIFVGLQIRHNTGALQRNEHNATMAQWTVIRMAIAKDRDIAELMTAGLEATAGAMMSDLLRTPRGEAWWRSAKHVGFIPGFVADVDALIQNSKVSTVVNNKA